MSETLSPAEIEALIARNSAGSEVQPDPSADLPAPAKLFPADGTPERAAESVVEDLPNGGRYSPKSGLDRSPGSAVEVAPGASSEGAGDSDSPSAGGAKDTLAADPVPMVARADAVLTEAAAAMVSAREAAPEDGTPDLPASGEADSEPGGGADAPGHTTIGDLFAQYVALFVGAGLISGAVVHFPLSPVRYAVIGAVGALVFAVASVVSEAGDRDPLRLLRVALASLALALGIGMISGGIQHFMDIPQRAAVLIPLGVVLSLAAFGSRHGLRIKRVDLAVVVPWLIIGVFALGFGLSQLAGIASAQGGGAGHGHESGATEGGGAAGAGHGEVPPRHRRPTPRTRVMKWRPPTRTPP